jgi:hypothetical protein
VIDRDSGDVVLQDGTRLGRALTLDEFVWESPLHAQARRGEGAVGWTSWRLDVELQTGDRGALCLRFLNDRLAWIEFSLPWDGPPFSADPAWKTAHDRWIEKVLGAAPPLSFPWGRVESVADPRSGGCSILIKY